MVDKIDSVSQFTDKGLHELESWLEPWFRDKRGGGVGVLWEDVGVGCDGSAFETYRDLLLAEPSLWGLWPMDDADDSPTLYNLVSAHDPLTVHEGGGHILTYEQPGPFLAGTANEDERSCLFAGTDTGISVGTGTWGDVNSPLDGSDSFTVEMWCYPTVAAYGYLVSFRATSGGIDFPFTIQVSRLVSTDLELTGSHGGVSFGATGYTLDLSAWHHIAFTWDGTTSRLYAAGAEVASLATAPLGFATNTICFGALVQVSPGPSSVYFDGRLSLAALYTDALDAATIATHAGL